MSESVIPTVSESLAEIRAEIASGAHQRMQRESIELSRRAAASGRSLGDQSLHEARERSGR